MGEGGGGGGGYEGLEGGDKGVGVKRRSWRVDLMILVMVAKGGIEHSWVGLV